MSYFHVRISVVGERHDEVRTDMDYDTLDRQVLEPYRLGQSITMNGRVLTLDSVNRIRISTSEQPIAQLIQRIQMADRASAVAVLGGPSYQWRAADSAEDVTHDYITGPPGTSAPAPTSPTPSAVGLTPDISQSERRSVFVIAGRDHQATSAVVALLRAFGLRLIEWEQAVARTGLPNPYIGDVVQTGLEMARAAVVILTPDDVVRLRADLLHDDDGTDERELRSQSRPNVYYEAGFADAIGRSRTVLVEVGAVKPFSDASGRHVVKYDGSAGKRNVLAQRLRVAGLDVDTSGTDWLVVGDVTEAVSSASVGLSQTATGPSSSTVDRSELARQIEALLGHLTSMRQRSRFDDLSDLPDDSLDFVFGAQAFLDSFARDSSYAREAEAVRHEQAHIRIPILAAALRSLRLELLR